MFFRDAKHQKNILTEHFLTNKINILNAKEYWVNYNNKNDKIFYNFDLSKLIVI